MAVRAFNYPESYVDFDEARIHRLNALSLFSAMNQLEHFYTTQQAEAAERYGDRLPPVIITEGGASFPDAVGADGAVDDSRRIDYLARHIAVAAESVPGVDLRGYIVWTLLDNFEWAAGYTQRFGLVHVDYQTQKRTPKDSYHWYRDLIATSKALAGKKPHPALPKL